MPSKETVCPKKHPSNGDNSEDEYTKDSKRRRYSESKENMKNGKTCADEYESDHERTRKRRYHPPMESYYGYNERYTKSSSSTESWHSEPKRRRRDKSSSSSGSSSPVRRSTRENPAASRCIGVFGLHTCTTQCKVRDIFSRFGEINRIQMVIDAQTGRSRGFCFIYFEHIRDAKAAKYACSGIQIDNRRIRVDYSITQRPHTPTPGIYMGRPSRYARRVREAYRTKYRTPTYYRDDYEPYERRKRDYRRRDHYSRSCSRIRSRSRTRSPQYKRSGY